VESYQLRVEQPCQLRWQQDPHGNHLARVSFAAGSTFPDFTVDVELVIDVQPVNPFDFFVDGVAETLPFAYPAALAGELAPFLEPVEAGPSGFTVGPAFEEFDRSLPREGRTVDLAVGLNQSVRERVAYVIREESGIYSPEETLVRGRGSCRDSALLLCALLRRRGLAARFVSGYLVQLTDEGLLPDVPLGMRHDVADLHAWAEVFLPGGGWIGLDATSGLLCGEGHVPLCCSARPELAAPIEGTSSVASTRAEFELKVARLGHEPRPTAPYTDDVWSSLQERGQSIDTALDQAGVVLTMGGEPTFNSRHHPDAPEWNGEALGPTKWSHGLQLAAELQRRLAPGSLLLLRQGKWYPGESLPRWALEIIGRRGQAALWNGPALAAEAHSTDDDAARLAAQLAERLRLGEVLMPAFEDPWRALQDEAALPLDVDPLHANLDDPEERRRLARVLDRGLGRPAGHVLPLQRDGAGWRGERWQFRRGHLFLVPGDSPIGLRLPLRSLAPAAFPEPLEPEVVPPDPRRRQASEPVEHGKNGASARRPPPPGQPTAGGAVRTALCVENRGGRVHVFLPPQVSAADFFALVAEIDAARAATGVDVQLEGYPPPPSPEVERFSVTPDPGVLEVNIAPTRTLRDYTHVMEETFEAALHAGLHCEKYLLDGRLAGSGGGHHLTMGGESPLSSVFLRRPDVLASLITFLQHHPSLAYLFAGLFVGPTSQAPRVDEARHEALAELELALDRAFQPGPGPSGTPGAPPPWLADLLFRHLLVDVSGNTHRTELCIDKLFDPQSPAGRQGLVELRAFEMPPHVRMAVAQMTLVRALVASFATPGGTYRRPLVRFGAALHDRYLLPYFLGRDLDDVLLHLERAGLALPRDAYTPFLELRCPLAGRLQAEDVLLEVRNALEPWPVLGEETTGAGTSRYVDSSLERIEVRVHGLLPERHAVLCNGHRVPLWPGATAGLSVAGIRFRAWAPPHSLQPHLGIHHPLRLEVVDTWARRSLGACAYHVWHPEGRAFDTPPLTRFEASARRAQRFTVAAATSGTGALASGPALYPVRGADAAPHPEAPVTLDLRRLALDRPMPEQAEETEPQPVVVGHTAHPPTGDHSSTGYPDAPRVQA
jgi:uncharacterized protein (DUF2126 family)